MGGELEGILEIIQNLQFLNIEGEEIFEYIPISLENIENDSSLNTKTDNSKPLETF